MHSQYKLTSKPAVASLLYIFVLLLVGVALITIFLPEDNAGSVVFFAVLVTLGFFIVRAIRMVQLHRVVKHRRKKLLDMQLKSGQIGASHIIEFRNNSLLELDKDNSTLIKNRLFDNFIKGDDYVYADYSYGEYRKTRHGEYLIRTHYYAVMATRFPRKLPHVLFDSLKARKRQFRFVYSGNQLHDLEGDFSKHFAVYFPRSYHIDSLSFVTPDVMWAMKQAADYDIEIVGDQLFLFGHQSDPETQIPDMSAKLAAIKSALVRSVSAYRDERLPYTTGRQSVAPLGAGLAKSLTKDYIWLALSVASLGIGVLIALDSGGWINYFTILGALGAVDKIWIINKELQHRKKLARWTANESA